MILPIGKLTASYLAAVGCAQICNIGWHSSSPCALSTPASGATSAYVELISLRGGQLAAHSAAALDLSRESYCITELATYATLTALVMNSALRLWTSTKFSKEQHPFISNSFTIATALCVVAGAFTAILFQLLGIYSKSALGMSNDVGYVSFKMATAMYRKWGFRCFLTALTSFVYSFMVSLYNKLWNESRAHPEQKRLSMQVGTYIMAVSVCLVLLGVFHIKNVLNLATQYIFIDAYSDKFA